jgi:hypothetical protein
MACWHAVERPSSLDARLEEVADAFVEESRSPVALGGDR